MLRSTFLFAALGSLVLLGCPAAPTPPAPPPPAPQIVALSATPARVKPNQKVTLTWETKNATRVELRQDDKGVVSGADALTGSVEVNVEQDALFVMVASNDRGVRDTAAAWVQVDDGAAEAMFVASPAEVRAGEPTVLAWNAQGASQVSLAEKGGANIDLGGQVESGSVVVTPTRETTYLLDVDGKVLETTVRVLPKIDAFTVTPSAAKPGEPLTVSWKTSAASKVTLGVASEGVLVTETEPSRVADGSYQFTVPGGINPAPVYTFTLLAEGATPEQAEKQHLQVYLAGKPTIVSWVAPQYALTGESFTLRWETSGADEVQVLRDGVVIHQAPNLDAVDEGSIDIPTPGADTKFQVRAFNHRGGEALSDEKTVSPVGIPSVMDFSTTPQGAIAVGGEPVTLTWNVPNARNLKITANNRSVHSASGVGAGSGSMELHPNENTTYVLTADNGVATSITPETRMVNVTTPARLVFSPSTVPAGSIIQLTGTTAAGTGTGTGDLYALDLVSKNLPGDAFIDIAGTGTALPFASGDDTTAHLISLSAPFQTTFGGVMVSGQKISVSVNGWLTFSNTALTGNSIPSSSFPSDNYYPQAVVVFGRDLQMDPSSRILWQEDGTGAQRRIIVQWDNVIFYSAAAKRVTAQAQFYGTGDVVIAYRDLQGLATTDKGAIGIVNSDDSTALSPSAAQLDANGRPSPGDTFHMYGKLTLPFPVTAGSAPVRVSMDMGTDRMNIEGAPTIIPAGQFTITEVNYNPAPGAAQWFEVVNNTGTDFDLTGWDIDFGGGVKHTIGSLGGTMLLPANGRKVFGQTANAAEGAAPVDYVYGSTYAMDPATAGAMGIGMSGGIYTGLSWAGPGTPGASLQRGILRADLLYSSTTPPELICHARQAYGSSGQKGTPGAPNGYCFWELTSIPSEFTPIAATGTGISGMISTGTVNSIDTVSKTVDFTATGGRAIRIGQAVYGNATTPLRVDSNGYITLSSTSNTGSNDTKPSTSGPNGTLAIFWDDLAANTTTNGPSGVYWQQFDPNPLASGDEYTLISWENWRRWASSTGTITSSLNFQIKVIEATGDVEYHYGSMTSSNGTYSNGTEATVWLESLDGTTALPVSVNQPNIQSNTAYRFTAL